MSAGPSNEAEQQVLDNFHEGRLTDFSGKNDAQRRIRGTFLTQLVIVSPTVSSGPRSLRLRQAIIEDQLDLAGAKIDVPIRFVDCEFEARPVLHDTELVSLRMPGCHCPGLDGTNLHVAGNLELNDGFKSTDEITLVNARIDGDFRLARANPRTSTNYALYASRLRVRGAFLGRELDTEGQIRMISAHVEGLLSFAASVMRNDNATTIYGERMQVGESLFFNKGFRSDGRIFLQNCSIGGGIDASGSVFGGAKQGSSAFQLVSGRVGRNMSFRGATINGDVNLRHSIVGGDIIFERTSFLGAPSEPRQLNLSQSTAFVVDTLFDEAPSIVDYRFAEFVIIKDAEPSWPGQLRLTGLRYQAIDSDANLRQRLRWLRLDEAHYEPSPYDRLAAAYRSQGNDQNADRVALEQQRQRRPTLNWPGRAFGHVIDGTVGYGYRNWKAAVWMLALWAAGSLAFALQHPVPLDATKPARLQPVVYAADVLLPIIDFGQANSFTPVGITRGVAWLLIVAGWILSTAVVAGLGRGQVQGRGVRRRRVTLRCRDLCG